MKRLLFVLLLSSFLAACADREQPLFQRLDPARTGVTFRNAVVPNDSLNAFTFTNFYNGGGVGVADFNQDGWPDLCFTANQAAPELFLGQGAMRFEKATGTGLDNPGWMTGISIADVNQDGWPDIYLSMAQHPSLPRSANLLYINQRTPTPTFVERAAAYGLDYPGFSMQCAWLDYDRDGDLDAFLLNTAPDGGNPNQLRPGVHDGSHPSTDRLFRNAGRKADGSFHYEDVSNEAGIRYEGLGLGVALADFNRDGWPDIYCSNDFQSDDALYLNQGDGSFRNVIKEAVKHTSLYGMGIDAADLNNDGHRDILQLDMLPEGSARQKQMIARGDYDKKQLSLSPPFDYNLQYMRNTLQMNLGLGDSLPVFSEQGFLYGLATTDWSWSVLLADYDRDGWKDVFITNGYRKNVTDLDFIAYNQEVNMFGNAQAREARRMEYLEAIPEIKLPNYAFRNSSGGRFEDVSAAWGLDDVSYSNGAAYADLDRDGDLDLVVNNIDEAAFVYENRSVGSHYLEIAFRGAVPNREGIGASVRACVGDRCQAYDYFPVRGYQSSLNTPLLIGLGPDTLLDRLEVRWPGGRWQHLRDVRAGQRLVLEEAEARAAESLASAGAPEANGGEVPPPLFRPAPGRLDYAHRESDHVDFRETPTLQRMLTRQGPAIAAGDFDGDGRSDVVIGGAYRGSPTVVYYQPSEGRFVAGDTLPTAHMEVGALAVLDADGDGRNDLFVAPGASERPLSAREAFQPLLFLRRGDGFEADPRLPALNLVCGSVLVEDLNGDGRRDLLLGGSYIPGSYPLTTPGAVLLRGADGFRATEAPWLPRDRAITATAAADIDRDGDRDILLTGPWSGVTLLRNTGNSYQPEDLGLPVGWYNCLRVADLDQDGDLDLVLGNEGQNTPFQASPQQPVRLLAKDFNEDGQIDPIYGLYLDGEEVAIHPLGTLTEQIVQYRKRFPRYRAYSTARLDDLFTRNDRRGARELVATELRSGWARNDGDGQFRFQPLPLAAQQAPVQDLLVEDFNGDALPDLLLVGNAYPNEPIFGRQDASRGLLLLGEGGGAFTVSPPAESGFLADGDMRRVLYLPEAGLVLVARNRGSVQAFSWNPPRRQDL